MGKLGSILVSIAIACAIVGWQYSKKGDVASEGHDIAIQIMADTMPNWSTHETLYTQWLDEHHERCFNNHYRVGSRRTSTKFDENAYWNDLFNSMASSASAAGYTDCESNLIALRDDFNANPVPMD